MPDKSTKYPTLPRVAVGAIVFHEKRVLLVKRGNPPMKSMWSIPGGSVRLGETLKEAAEREIKEETGITIIAGDPVLTFDVIEKDKDGKIQYHYVITDLSATYIKGTIHPGDDAADAKWFTRQDLNTHLISPTTFKLLTSHYQEQLK